MGTPEIYPGEIHREVELIGWIKKTDLTGKVVISLDELKKLFPEDGTYGGVFLSDESVNRGGIANYDIFSRIIKTRGKLQKVAYHCHDCDNILIGPMNVENLQIRGLRANCTLCYASLINERYEHID